MKTYIDLYQNLEKYIKSLRIPASELRTFEMNLPIYLESYVSDAFGDTGTLQGMQDLESRPLAILHTNIQAQVCLLNGNRKTLRRFERVQHNSGKGYAMYRRIQTEQR